MITSGVLDMPLPVGFLGYDGVCRHGSFSRVIFGSGHLYHSQQVAAYMPGLHKVDKFLAYEPAVYKKVVKVEAFKDDPLDLTYSVIQLALEVLIHTLGRTAVRITLFAEASFRFLLRQTLRRGLLLSHLTLKGEVNEGLGHAISTEKEQALVAKDTLVLDVSENTSQQFSLRPTLGRSVSSTIRHTGSVLFLESLLDAILFTRRRVKLYSICRQLKSTLAKKR